jgi:hypothetical protein
MLLTLHWKAIIHMTSTLELLHQWYPHLLSFATVHECFGVADQNQGISGSRQKNIDSLRSTHEPDVTIAIATGQACDDDFTFFTLIIV